MTQQFAKYTHKLNVSARVTEELREVICVRRNGEERTVEALNTIGL